MDSHRANKVEPRCSSCTLLKADAAKRLRNMFFACKAPHSAIQGILAWLMKYEALLTVLSSRERNEDIVAALHPLASLAALAKKVVRKRGGVTVTLTMQEDLRQILAWNAKACSSALDGGVFKFDNDDNDGQTEVRIIIKESILRITMGATNTSRSAYPGIPTAPNTPPTLPPLPRTRENSIDSLPSPLRTRENSTDLPSSQYSSSSSPISEAIGGGAIVVYSPRIEAVFTGAQEDGAGQLVVDRADLLAAILPPGSVTVGRWCSWALGVCVSGARCWW